MSTLVQDTRFALRTLGRSKITTVTAVAAIAIGIGAATVMFSVVNPLLARPFRFPELDRIAAIYMHHPTQGVLYNELSPADFIDIQRQSKSFESIAAYGPWEVNVAGDDGAEIVQGLRVTPEFFRVTGTPAALGRVFGEMEAGQQVVVISDRLWRRRFGGERWALGHALSLDGEPYTVIGVMPATFDYPSGAELWAPLTLTPKQAMSRGNHYLIGLGKLRPRVDVARADAELGTISDALAREHPESNDRWKAHATPLVTAYTGHYGEGLRALAIAVMFLLLIACTNVANLLLARSGSRSREIAIRTAVGAGRRRIIRQLLTESVLLSILGGGVGVLLAIWGTDFTRGVLPAEFSRFIAGWDRIRVDGGVLAFALGLSVATGLMFGLVPALHASRTDLVHALKLGDAGNRSGSRSRLRDALAIAEVALALALLVGAGLSIQSLLQARSVAPGFDPGHLLTMKVSLTKARYTKDAQITDYLERALQTLRALPGVESVAATSFLPLGGASQREGFDIEGRPAARPADRPDALVELVTPHYFETMRIPLKAGRDFGAHDDLTSTGVVVVNETLARRFFPNESAIGHRIVVDGKAWEIVGVCGSIRNPSLFETPLPTVYYTYGQFPLGVFGFVVRTTGNPGKLAAQALPALRGVDPLEPVFQVNSMRDVVDRHQLIGPNFLAGFLMVFGLLALVLAVVGIFGVMSYAVSLRTREIGVRMAMGAERRAVLGMVLRDGAKLTLVGVAIGIAAAFGLGRLMANVLYGVRPNDLATFGLVIALLGGVSLLACWIPALRATRVDPVVALRSE